MLAAVFCFSVGDIAVKWLGGSYALFQIVAIRTVFGVVPLVWLIRRAGGVAALRTSRPWLHVAQGLLSAVALMLLFQSFIWLPIADAYAILLAAPLIVTALSVVLLRESVEPQRWAAVTLGFIGVLIVLQPGQTGGALLSLPGLVCVLAAVTYATVLLFVRYLTRTESPALISAANLVAIFLFGATGSLFTWQAVTVWTDWLVFALSGLAGGAGMVLLILALSRAPASVVAPLDYTGLIWAIIFGLVLFGDVPGVNVVLGGAIIIASGLYAWRRERLQSKETP